MNPTKPEQIASPEPATMSEARRKLIRAGLATGPVVATLASPSVFAADCVAPSQTLSAARSHTTQLGSCETGSSSATWTSNLANPSYTGACAGLRTKPFHDVFIQQGGNSATRMYKSDATTGVAKAMTFLEVLQDSSRVMAREFLAAYLNICSKNILFPVDGIKSQATSAKAIVDMWNEWAVKGSYTPYSGATAWDATKIKFYLANFVPGP